MVTTMRTIGRLAVVLLALSSVALSGCASDKVQKEEVYDFEEVEVDADTGLIRGVVVDAAVRPVAEAQVTVTSDLLDEPRSMASNSEGLFLFSKLPPGAYQVHAEKEGFLAGRMATDVQAGVETPPIVKILLELDPAALPYVQVYQWDGFIECSFSLLLVRFAACSGVGNDHFLEEYTFEGPPSYIQSEMTWQSTQALGDEMQLSVTDASTGVQVQINASAGKSPVLLGINETQIQKFGLGVNNTPWWRVFNDAVDETDVAPDEEVQDAWGSVVYPVYNSTAPQEVKDEAYMLQECVKWPTLFDACMGAGGVGATIQQEFQVYTHAFYNFQPPVGWRFSVDGTPEP